MPALSEGAINPPEQHGTNHSHPKIIQCYGPIRQSVLVDSPYKNQVSGSAYHSECCDKNAGVPHSEPHYRFQPCRPTGTPFPDVRPLFRASPLVIAFAPFLASRHELIVKGTSNARGVQPQSSPHKFPLAWNSQIELNSLNVRPSGMNRTIKLQTEPVNGHAIRSFPHFHGETTS